MSKERTTLRDLLVALHCALRLHGWTLCPSCGRVMLATIADAYRVPVAFHRLAVTLAQASHLEPDADGGDRVALECGICNRVRGRSVWDAPDGVTIVRKGDRRAGRAYRAAAAARTEQEARRSLPVI